jgi:hypothetical protein
MFDGLNAVAISLSSKHDVGVDQYVVDKNGSGAGLAAIAAKTHAENSLPAQQFHQGFAGMGGEGSFLPVEGKLDLHGAPH